MLPSVFQNINQSINFLNYYTKGKLFSDGSSISEGIGQGRITKNLELAVIDDCFQISDRDALPLILISFKMKGFAWEAPLA